MISRPKVGVLVNNLGPSQGNFYMIMEALKRHEESDFTFFYENLIRPCVDLPCAAMQFNEMYSFAGPIVSTSLQTTYKLLSAPAPTKKYYYIQDLEWLRYNNKDFHQLAEIYQNPKINLICRSECHKILIESCWNVRVVHVCPTFKEVFNEIVPKNPTENKFLQYGDRQNLPRRTLL